MISPTALTQAIKNLDARIRKIDNREPRLQEWQTPTLINSWANIGAPYSNAGYWKDPHGIVRLRGAIDTGTAPSDAFVLPANYRPEALILFDVPDGANVSIEPDGSVFISLATSDVFLDSISFRAFA